MKQKEKAMKHERKRQHYEFLWQRAQFYTAVGVTDKARKLLGDIENMDSLHDNSDEEKV